MTDRYQRLRHHDTSAELLEFAAAARLSVVAVDNVPGSVRLEQTTLPRDCLLVFGQEGPGITAAAKEGAGLVVSIATFVAVNSGFIAESSRVDHKNLAENSTPGTMR